MKWAMNLKLNQSSHLSESELSSEEQASGELRPLPTCDAYLFPVSSDFNIAFMSLVHRTYSS